MICLLIKERYISGPEVDENQNSCIFWGNPSERFSFLLSICNQVSEVTDRGFKEKCVGEV